LPPHTGRPGSQRRSGTRPPVPPMTPEPYTAWVLLIVFVSAVARSTFGFGAAQVAMPLLSFLVPLPVASALMAILSTVLAGAIIVQEWRSVEAASVWRLLSASAASIPLGVWLVKGGGERLA